MEAIIISGLPAAGKTEVARLLGMRLGLRELGGGDILKGMAAEEGYTTGGSDWWDTEQGIEFLKERERNPKFDKEVDRRMLEKIKEGNIVVTSWTMPWLSDTGFKIWLDASRDVRAKRMALRDKTDIDTSRRTIDERDTMNYDLYGRLYGIKLGRDKNPFDVIINTDKLTVEQVADEILKRIKK